MKKLLYTFLAVSIIFAACKKEEDDTTPAVTSIVGIWNATKTTEDVSFSVSMGGVILEDTSYVAVSTDSLEPSSLEFLSNGTLYVYNNEDADTATYVRNGNSLTITDVDTTFTLDINKLDANNLILIMDWETAYVDYGLDVVEDVTITMEFARSTIIYPTVNQRLENTNHSWFVKPRIENILKSIK
jgi:hypothetical protein|tara:strand:- start:145 stop:702 length:558 start_codon:yes stop_codon:yes gene_type:complete